MIGVTRDAIRSAHMQNFLDCIRSGSSPNCPFELGFRVSIACRMAVESYRQGRTMHWDAGAKKRSSNYEDPMDFEYTPEQIQLRRAVREFAEAEIAPHVHGVGRGADVPARSHQETRAARLHGRDLPRGVWAARAWATSSTPSSSKSLSRVDGSVGIIVAAHTSLCTNHIYKAGSDEQKQRYLPKLASGEWIGCWSLTEPEAGSDAAGTRTHRRARWRLLGAQRRPRRSPPTPTTPTSASPWR